MPYDLSETLVVGVSATALFDLQEEDALFKEELERDPSTAIQAYRKVMLERENDRLDPGAGYPLVKALLGLNRHSPAGKPPLVEVVIMSRNSPETGLRILKNIREHDLAMTRHMFTGGESVVDYLDAFSVDLFLSTNVEDAQVVADSDLCAAAVLSVPPGESFKPSTDQVRIAFDGDAVLFSEKSEIIYKTEGMDEFHAQESAKEDILLEEGPFAAFLLKLAKLQERLPESIEFSPVRVALITARNSPSEIRVVKTLRKWGVYIDEAFFLGGVEKTKIVKAFQPHIFFDDQDVHLKPASQHVPVAKVLYKSDSVLNEAVKNTATDPEDEN
ncbi:5'-nucleotidase [Granulosicoccus sp. 3-233]|uniref:5'-nucleotidase n=1 Tax=Granulosicoccus sp. 3-233 TaxID=3417969 RepID=UPI003D343CD5